VCVVGGDLTAGGGVHQLPDRRAPAAAGAESSVHRRHEVSAGQETSRQRRRAVRRRLSSRVRRTAELQQTTITGGDPL